MSDLLALLMAYGLALPIAWDRERHERSAGLRTFPLVALAACGFILASASTVGSQQLSRIIQGIIGGVGFIGGGAILKQDDTVKGTATAASLWATGAIGAAVALQKYDVALIMCALTVCTLRLLASAKKEIQ